MAGVWMWVGVFFLLIIIAVAIGLIVWSQGQHKHRANNKTSWVTVSADDVQTGDILELAVVTGATGATSDSGWLTILSTTIETECPTTRLYSRVSAFTSIGTIDGSLLSGGTSLSTEVASIDVRVLVDTVAALPGDITFDSLTHVLESTLSEAEFLVMIENRGAAHSYDFITRDVAAGSHTVEVQARAIAAATADPATVASAAALIGDRTLVVQQGRLTTSSSTSCPSSHGGPPSSSSSSSHSTGGTAI